MQQMPEYETGKGKDRKMAKAIEIEKVAAATPSGAPYGRRYLILVDYPMLEVSAEFMTNDPQPGDFIVFEGGNTKNPTLMKGSDFKAKYKKFDKTKLPKNKKEWEKEDE